MGEEVDSVSTTNPGGAPTVYGYFPGGTTKVIEGVFEDEGESLRVTDQFVPSDRPDSSNATGYVGVASPITLTLSEARLTMYTNPSTGSATPVIGAEPTARSSTNVVPLRTVTWLASSPVTKV